MSGKPYDVVKYMIKNSAALAARGSNRTYHALAPESPQLPNYTFWESGGVRRQTGLESQDYVINCRAKSMDDAMDLARLVINLFHGTSSSGIYGTENGFDIARCFLDTGSGIVPEPGGVYNAPVIITLVYTSNTVS